MRSSLWECMHAARGSKPIHQLSVFTGDQRSESVYVV